MRENAKKMRTRKAPNRDTIYKVMIANLDKFQARILNKNATDVTHKLRIYNNEIETTICEVIRRGNWLSN